jgi:hypothetical protein
VYSPLQTTIKQTKRSVTEMSVLRSHCCSMHGVGPFGTSPSRISIYPDLAAGNSIRSACNAACKLYRFDHMQRRVHAK